MNKNYYIGLDCGTSSVGWAITDENYNIIRMHGKDMWGSHIFEAAETAAKRRMQREARRSNERRRERVALLSLLFREPIGKIDPGFFQRLSESYLHLEDRSENNRQPFSLFADRKLTDKDYYKAYPTIYHLRLALMNGTAPHDPRLVYLALHHILSYRGHFLFPGTDMNTVMHLSPVMESFFEEYSNLMDEDIHPDISFNEIESLMLDDSKKLKERIRLVSSHLIVSASTKCRDAAVKTMFGYKIRLSTLFGESIDSEIEAIEFKKSTFDEDLLILKNTLSSDQFHYVTVLKEIYDWKLLAKIMAGSENGLISEAKVKLFENNRNDRNLLKKVVKKYRPEIFDEFFYGDNPAKALFSNYTGTIHSRKRGDRKSVSKNVSVNSFYDAVKSLLKDMPQNDSDVCNILSRIESDSFLVLPKSNQNSAIPYQIHRKEFISILDHAECFMPWLRDVDDAGLSVREKLISIMDFRVPYYVGPLSSSSSSPNVWAVRKHEGKVYPWNFEEMIDEEASDELFIRRMTNRCTYLGNEDVLPASSLLYQKFLVLNEINPLQIDGHPLSVQQKQDLYEDLFVKECKNVTKKTIAAYAVRKGWAGTEKDAVVSGVDDKLKSKLSSAHMLSRFPLSEEEKEWVIYAISLHPSGGRVVEKRIREKFGDRLSPKDIRALCRMKFTGWGRLSKELLAGIRSKTDGIGKGRNIITLMMETNENLMQVISNGSYDFSRHFNRKPPVNSLEYSILDDERMSPSVRRQVWQAMKIVEANVRDIGYPPKRIFIEVTRHDDEAMKGKKIDSRKSSLLKTYRDNKLDKAYPEIYRELQNEDAVLLSRKNDLFLYYRQLGRCVYTGEVIDRMDILHGMRGTTFDIDHIYPYSKSKDDSLINKVLVNKPKNGEKADRYPLDPAIQEKMTDYWKMLSSYGLMEGETYNRLVRTTPFSADEFKTFINRQLVETSQSTKILADVLQRYFGDSTTVVYSKAADVSAFRQKFKIWKARSVNDLHHAKDAYLNIVVGNSLYVKYTSDYFRKHASFNDPFAGNIKGAWDREETLQKVRTTCARNSVICTIAKEKRTGKFFNQVVKAGSKKDLIPAKITDPHLQKLLATSDDKEKTIKEWTDRYGGYTSIMNSHFALIRVMEKKKISEKYIPIPIMYANQLKTKEAVAEYCRKSLHMTDVEVLQPIVPMNSVIRYKGVDYLLTGVSGRQLCLKATQPLLLDNDQTFYVSKLERFARMKHVVKDLKVDPENDKINKEENEELYEVLRMKSHAKCYETRPANQSKLFDNGRDRFKTLNLEDQVACLLEMIKYFAMYTEGKADLSLIGGSKNAGILHVSDLSTVSSLMGTNHLVVTDPPYNGLSTVLN